MSETTILYWLDIIGTMVFAMSGAMSARDKGLDLFGIATLAFVTAIGGGTIRDILIGSLPVGWMKDLTYLSVIFIGYVISLFFGKSFHKLRRTFFFFDTIGIAVFTVLGLQEALLIGVHPVIAIMMGMVSATFGGVVRDVICNEIPLIFRREIYALTCLVGAGLYILLSLTSIPQVINVVITVVFIALFRFLAVKNNWSLPQFR